MKRAALLVLIAIAAACASQQDKGPPVAVDIEQLDTPPTGFYYPGVVNIRYQVTVSNGTDQPVTLRRVDLRTPGSGAYIMRSPNVMLNLKVPPKTAASTTFFAWGQALGGNLHANEPVTLSMTAYFESPKGSFLRTRNQIIQQQQ